MAKTKKLQLTQCGPGRDLPFGMISEVADVLGFHGVDPPVMVLIPLLGELLRRTPIDQGGRLRPDGTVDEEMEPGIVLEFDTEDPA